jgi:hypothetical protein
MNPKTVEAVCALIRQMTAQGHDCLEIAEHLNSVLPLSNSGNRWEAGSVVNFCRTYSVSYLQRRKPKTLKVSQP